EMRVIDAVVGAVYRDPDILGAPVGLAEAVDDDLGNACVAREQLRIAAEADDFARRTGAALEDESGDHKVAAAEAKVRGASEQHFALGLCGEGDRRLGSACAGEYKLRVAPFAIAQDNGIAGLR